MSLSGTVAADLKLTHVKAGDFVDASLPLVISSAWTVLNGTGGGQANVLFADQRTLGASATEDLDLAGVLADIYGALLTFVKLKGVFFRAAAGNTNAVQITRPATNGVPLFLAASDGIALGPGEFFLWAAPTGAGKAVTPATGDLITVTNGGAGTSVTYDVVLLGTDA